MRRTCCFQVSRTGTSSTCAVAMLRGPCAGCHAPNMVLSVLDLENERDPTQQTHGFAHVFGVYESNPVTRRFVIQVVETADYMRQRAAAAAMPSRPAVEPVHIINLNTSQQSGPQSSQASSAIFDASAMMPRILRAVFGLAVHRLDPVGSDVAPPECSMWPYSIGSISHAG